MNPKKQVKLFQRVEVPFCYSASETLRGALEVI